MNERVTSKKSHFGTADVPDKLTVSGEEIGKDIEVIETVAFVSETSTCVPRLNKLRTAGLKQSTG